MVDRRAMLETSVHRLVELKAMLARPGVDRDTVLSLRSAVQQQIRVTAQALRDWRQEQRRLARRPTAAQYSARSPLPLAISGAAPGQRVGIYVPDRIRPACFYRNARQPDWQDGDADVVARRPGQRAVVVRLFL